jgi:hypothetical protein
MNIKIEIKPGISPTELAVIRLFCSETRIDKKGRTWATRWIQNNAVPYTHKYLIAERLYLKEYSPHLKRS